MLHQRNFSSSSPSKLGGMKGGRIIEKMPLRISVKTNQGSSVAEGAGCGMRFIEGG